MGLEVLQDFFLSYGYFGLFFILIFIAAVPFPLPEDVISLGVGFLIYHNVINIFIGMPVLFLGIFAGDTYVYELGHFLRKRIFKIAPFKWIFHEKSFYKAERFFNKYHYFAIVFGRFMFGLRAQVYLHAGINQLPRNKYYLMNSIMVVFHASLLAFIGYVAHNQIEYIINKMKEWSKHFGLIGKIVFIIMIAFVIFLIIKYLIKKRKSKSE